MAEQIIRLLYPPSIRNLPILNQLIRRYKNLTINILRSQVNTAESWLEVQVIGSAAVIENAIGWLHEQGVEVQTLSA